MLTTQLLLLLPAEATLQLTLHWYQPEGSSDAKTARNLAAVNEEVSQYFEIIWHNQHTACSVKQDASKPTNPPLKFADLEN